ncbi:tetratricopeptide repeat protein [Streptomyces sp. NPDC048430]|uniref:tetratricopeptide repeat protein n=1 Tax=unclassified Streptomyces TaxID=2593676 RepID=UPI0034286FB5
MGGQQHGWPTGVGTAAKYSNLADRWQPQAPVVIARGSATVDSRNNLAGAYETAGDLGKAIPLCETTLTQCEQVLGNTHQKPTAPRTVRLNPHRPT